MSCDTIGRHLVNNRLAMSRSWNSINLICSRVKKTNDSSIYFRSIGDLDLKPFGVTAEPEVTHLNIRHGRDKFLVLTTDGVNYVMSDDEIVDCISTCADPKEAAERLVDQALLYSSEDNISVIVVPLGSWGKGDNAKTSMLYTLGRNMANTSRFS